MTTKQDDLHIRLSHTDHEAVRSLASKNDMTVTQLVHFAVTSLLMLDKDDSETLPDIIKVDTQTYNRINGELYKQGVNLNQLTHGINTCAKILRENPDILDLKTLTLFVDTLECMTVLSTVLYDGYDKCNTMFESISNTPTVKVKGKQQSLNTNPANLTE